MVNEESPIKFEEVYERYAEKIYTFIYYKTYHKESAEDLTGTTFMKALDKWDSYRPGKGKVSSWLYAIARNCVIDHFRKQKKTMDIQDIWDLAGEEDVLLDAHNREQMKAVYEVMKTLPIEQRDILIMRIWQDISYKEIARILGKSEGACKMTFSRTISRLKKDLAAFMIVYLFKCMK